MAPCAGWREIFGDEATASRRIEFRRGGADDVNAYLQEIAGSEFSAKDFRTWSATVLAAAALLGTHAFASQTLRRAVAAG